MNEKPEDIEARRMALSRLMDGDAAAADEACRAFRADAGARADWHAYHLIGDLLRSGDQPRSPTRDAAFLAALRARLADEPAVLAPAPLAASTPQRRAWLAPAAVAAGFAAVAAALVVTRVAAPPADDRMALAPAGATAATATPAASAAPTFAGAGADSVFVRSAELDRYLAAHRQYAPMSTLAAPAGLMRSATVTAPQR